ncbi:MAG: hypothetical protein Q9226_001968 [Calogaya cf. arnoldii]
MTYPVPHKPPEAFERPYNPTAYLEKLDMKARLLKGESLSSIIREFYVAESSPKPDEETQITYANLPKIPLRLRSLRSDLSLLGVQFFDTLIVLQHLIHRRMFPRHSTQQHQQHNYRIVHLHTDPKVSLQQLIKTLMLQPDFVAKDIALIFPVVDGVWELLVKEVYLTWLSECSYPEFPVEFREPSKLPKGIVGRTAQIHSLAEPDDRWVSGIYMGFVEQFPWNHIMKDTAESMSIRQSKDALIGSQVYKF